nr:FRIGIDA-like protein 5 [Quercus suber]
MIIGERLKEYDLKEKRFGERVREFEARERQFAMKEMRLGERFEEFGERLKRFELREKRYEEFEVKEKQFGERLKRFELREMKLNERFKEFDSKEKRFAELEVREKKLNERCKEFDLKEKRYGERGRELEAKEKRLGECLKKVEEWHKLLELKEKKIEERSEELALNEKKCEERYKELKSKEKRLEELELREESIEQRSRDIELKENRYVELIQDFEAKEKRLGDCLKEFEEWHKELGLKDKKIEERSEELVLNEKKYEERFKEFELKEKHFKETIKELELTEKRFTDFLQTQVNTEPLEDFLANDVDNNSSSSASPRFCVKMGGKSLQIFLNEHWKEHDLMRDEVAAALRLSLDPAKLVLDAMEGFYPPHLKKEDVEFDERIVQGSCVLLLEQLLELSPDIKPQVKQEAMILAMEWRMKMKVDAENSLEVLGFLQLLASYRLTSAFDADELVKYLEKVAEHEQMRKLCGVLGLDNKIPSKPSKNLITMDGKSLQIFLNERWKEHNSMRHEVANTLRLSSDPSKLVLDAMEGFYPPHLKKGDVEFDESVIRGSCVLLLEHLFKLSPSIKPDVKREAMRLAMEWRVKMMVDTQHSLEVLGFLQLLASYGLASAFDADELLLYLEKVAEHEQLPGLCQILGVDNKVPGLIQNLIKRKQLPGAIRLIYVFKLADKFPPRDLLKDCLKCSNNSSKSFFKKKNRSPKAQVSFQNFKSSITLLKKRKRKAMKKKTKLALGSKKHIAPVTPAAAPIPAPIPTYITENNLTSPATIAKTTGHAPAPAPAPLTPVQQRSGSKRPWIAVSADAAPNTSEGSTSTAHLIELPHQEPASLFSNKVSCTVHSHVKSGQLSKESSPLDSREASLAMNPQQDPKCSSVNEDGEILRSLLNNQVEYDSMRSKVSDALQSVPDPDKLVLDAIKGIYPSNLKGDEGFKLGFSRNFTLLLKQLIFSPQMKPLVKEATKFANDWNSRLKNKRDDLLEVLAFLQFLVAYGLTSSFYANEILGLLDTDVWHKKVPDLCRVLGLTDIMPTYGDKQRVNLRAVRSWIEIYKLEDENFPEILEKHIAEQEKQQAEKKHDSSNVKNGPRTRSKATLLQQHQQQQTSCSPKTLGSEMNPQKNNQVRPQHTEQICIAPTTMITATSAPSTLTSGNTPKSEPQEHSGSKRHRTEVPREAPPISAVGATSGFHSMQPPNWQPPGLFMDQYAPYVNTSARHYSLSGYPLPNVHMKAYIIPDYPREALRIPD